MSLTCPVSNKTPSESSASSSVRSLQPSPSKSHSEDGSSTTSSKVPPNTNRRLTAASSLASFFPNNSIPFELSSSHLPQKPPHPPSSPEATVASPRRKLPSDPLCPATNRRNLFKFRVKAESFTTLN
uniref:Uncharacterized protein n=1 Tax=Panagrolaimus davidi TaxID=227884 RepID=A0A914P9G8_9BILA